MIGMWGLASDWDVDVLSMYVFFFLFGFQGALGKKALEKCTSEEIISCFDPQAKGIIRHRKKKKKRLCCGSSKD